MTGSSVVLERQRVTVVFADHTYDAEAIEVPYLRNLGISDLRGTDAAMLRVSATRSDLVPLGQAPAPNERAWVAVSDRSTRRPSTVEIVATREDTIYTRSITRGGLSGSPLLSERGALLGIASWRSGRMGDGALSAFTAVAPLAPWIDCVRTTGGSDDPSQHEPPCRADGRTETTSYP
jgi:hypothetical protein